MDFNTVFVVKPVAPVEFAYPSDPCVLDKNYYWSALCRRVQVYSRPGDTMVQVTVFVSRKTGAGTKYYDATGGSTGQWPVPIKVNVSSISANNEITITNDLQKTYITAGSTIVEDATGNIYRVTRRDDVDTKKIYLNRNWQGGNTVWVIPPPVGGGRYPCIGVYQKVILF